MRKFFLPIMTFIFLAGAAMAADATIPNRMGTAKVGEWVLMRELAGDNMGKQTRYTVAEVRGTGDEAVIVLKLDRLEADGTISESKNIDITIAKYNARMQEIADKAKQIGRERISIKGTDHAVTAVHWDDESEQHEYKIWISGELPVGGLVKSWSSDPDFPASELIDYGF